LRKLTIVFHNAGGGHRSAAEALKGALSTQKNPWDVSLLDIQDLLDPIDLIRRASGLRIQDTYNLLLRKGWTRFTPQLLVVLQATIRAYHGPIVKALRDHWSAHPTDMVLSVIPHFNREIAASVRNGDTHTPFVTLITDLADYPPRFWIEPESQYIIAGTARAREQALRIGVPPENVFQTSGLILKPKFYEETAIDRPAERRKLGLEPDCTTGIVLFGGHGSQVMVDITRRIQAAARDVQLILICGHNEKLAAQLKTIATRKPKLVVGFAQNVEYYMALSDFFIGKPGPGSISEALQLHLPVIVECNAKTLPQERYNAEWVTENGYGIVVSTFKTIASAIDQLLEHTAFENFRRRTSTYSNRSLFEVPGILEQCAERAIPALAR
jgi:1,2-diacylglycerol 3-beta-galactosyltransferase